MRHRLVVLTFATILLFGIIVNAGSVTIFVNDSAARSLILGDAFVREDLGGNDNFGNDDDLHVQSNDFAARRTYIKFNLTTLNDIDVILNATLILVEDNNFTSNTMNAGLHEVYLNGTSKWCEGNGGNNNDAQLCSAIGQNGTYEVTWNNQPCGTTENNIGVSGNCSNIVIENRSLSNTNNNTTFDITNLSIKYLRDKVFSIIIAASNESLNPGSSTVQFESKEEVGFNLDPLLNISYVILPPNSSLISPSNNQTFVDGSTINFTCNSIDDTDLVNITLYQNINGNFMANQTRIISGLSNSSNFSINNINAGNYIWNCLSCNKYGACEFNNINFTLNINGSQGSQVVNNITLNNPLEIPVNGSSYIKDNFYYFNITVTNTTLISSIVITFNNTNYTVTSNFGNIYSFNILDLAAGTYQHIWHGYLSDGTSNKTDTLSYTVNKVISIVNLSLNGDHSNITVNISDNVNISTLLSSGVGNITVYDNGDAIAIGENVSVNVSYSFNGTHLINASYDGNENYTSSDDILTITIVNNTISNGTNQSGNQGQGGGSSSSLSSSPPTFSPLDSGIKKVEETFSRRQLQEVRRPEQTTPPEINPPTSGPSEPVRRAPFAPITGSAVREAGGLFGNLAGSFIKPLQNKETGSILILFAFIILIIIYLKKRKKSKFNGGSLKEWKVKHQETYDIHLRPISEDMSKKIENIRKRRLIENIKKEVYTINDYKQLSKPTIKRFVNIKVKERSMKPVFNPIRKINKDKTSEDSLLEDLKKVYKIE